MVQRRKSSGQRSPAEASQRRPEPLQLRDGNHGDADGERPDGFPFLTNQDKQPFGLGRIDTAGGKKLQDGSAIGRHNGS